MSKPAPTTEPKCLPGCRSLQYNHGASYLHLPGCPNAEAPKVEELCATCQKQESLHHGSMHGFRKPEPKQGSEVTAAQIEGFLHGPDCFALQRAYLALRAELTQAEKACALALDYVQGSPRPRHMDVVSALREVIARAKEGEER